MHARQAKSLASQPSAEPHKLKVHEAIPSICGSVEAVIQCYQALELAPQSGRSSFPRVTIPFARLTFTGWRTGLRLGHVKVVLVT